MYSLFESKNECYGCSSCVQICPVNAISFESDNEGFFYPSIDASKCNNCGLCKKACPIYKQPPSLSDKAFPQAYAVSNKNDKVRSVSTSGGVFTALANKFLSDEGYVFGVAFDKSFKAIHTGITAADQLDALRGSKYTQSFIGDSYRRVKELLSQNKKVLFSGTPCQISGLYSHLGKEYNNLFTCDCVCHGVPSPGVFEMYKKHLQKLNNSEIEAFSFRNKSSSWKNYNVYVKFKNGNKYIKSFKEDPFMIGFITNVYLRPSCHTCKYASTQRQADITLADFWGVDKFYPELDDDKGTSLILINTPKGNALFNSCKSELKVSSCDLALAAKENPSLLKPSPPSKNRLKFFEQIDINGFEYLKSQFLSPPSKFKLFIRKSLNYSKRLLKHFLRN